ncbi:MAG: hypothetical protein Tsb0021_10160 [Chlamydiales bacterium]
MNMIPPAIHYEVQQPLFFDIGKVEQTYRVYQENHPGLTLVIGHPFEDEEFLRSVIIEQQAIKHIFSNHGLEKYLYLYTPKQIHCTIIELASQHDETNIEQNALSRQELECNKNQDPISINYAIEWINQTRPFEIELGQGVLSEEHADQTIRITPTGQIVMKGRAKERKLLSLFRTDFEDSAGIIHKYNKNDDEIFFVIGYVAPSDELNHPHFIRDLTEHIKTRREMIQLSMKVSEVAVILYQKRTLEPEACLKQWRFQLSSIPEITDLFKEVIKECKHIHASTIKL